MPRALRSSGPPYPTLHTTHPSLESIIESSRLVAHSESPPKKLLIKQHRKGKVLELVCSEGKRCKSRLRKEDRAQQVESGGEEGEEREVCGFRLKAEPYVPYEPLLGLESDHKYIITIFVPHTSSIHESLLASTSNPPAPNLTRKRSRPNLTSTTPGPNRASSTPVLSSNTNTNFNTTSTSTSNSTSTTFQVPLITGRKLPLKRPVHSTPEEAQEYSNWLTELGGRSSISTHPSSYSYPESNQRRVEEMKPWKNWGWVNFEELREKGEELKFGGVVGSSQVGASGRILGEPFSGIPFRSILDDSSGSQASTTMRKEESEMKVKEKQMEFEEMELDVDLEREATLGLLALWGQSDDTATLKEMGKEEEKKKVLLGTIEETPECADMDLEREQEKEREEVEEEEEARIPIPQDTSTTPIEPNLPLLLLLPEDELPTTDKIAAAAANGIGTEDSPPNALGLVNLNPTSLPASIYQIEPLESSASPPPPPPPPSLVTLQPEPQDEDEDEDDNESDSIDLPTKPQSESEFEHEREQKQDHLLIKSELERSRSHERKMLVYDEFEDEGSGDVRVKEEEEEMSVGRGRGQGTKSQVLEDRWKAKRLRKMLFKGGEERWDSTYSLKSLEFNLASLEKLSPPINFTINFSFISLLTHRPHIHALPRLSSYSSSSSSSNSSSTNFPFSPRPKSVLRDLYGFELTPMELSILEQNANEEFWEYVEMLEKVRDINRAVRDRLDYRESAGRDRERERGKRWRR